MKPQPLTRRRFLATAGAGSAQAAGALFAAMGGSHPKVGATCGLIYLLGLIVIW